MSKPIIYVGLAVAHTPTDLISLGARTSQESCSANFEGGFEILRSYRGHETEWANLREEPISARDGLKLFYEWLTRYKGNYIAICQGTEFYALYQAMNKELGKCPFGADGFIDYPTFVACKAGDYSFKGKRFGESRNLVEKATKRFDVVRKVVDGTIQRALYGPEPF